MYNFHQVRNWANVSSLEKLVSALLGAAVATSISVGAEWWLSVGLFLMTVVLLFVGSNNKEQYVLEEEAFLMTTTAITSIDEEEFTRSEHVAFNKGTYFRPLKRNFCLFGQWYAEVEINGRSYLFPRDEPYSK